MDSVESGEPRGSTVLTLQVEVAYSPAARRVDLVLLRLNEGSTALQALHASGLLKSHPELDPASLTMGIWGRAVSPGHVLCAGDRLELYRPLQVDPKEARRLRYRAQGERGRSARRSTPDT